LHFRSHRAQSHTLGKMPSVDGLTSSAVRLQTMASMEGITMSKRIALAGGRFAIVDDADFECLNQHKWHYLPGPRTGYARRRQEGLMHQVILTPPPGMQIDHINGDGLDNRRCNLRICTRSQNQQNSRKHKGCTSLYKGVCQNIGRGKPWAAYICTDGKVRQIDSFDDEWEAAKAYNDAAKKHFRKFAKLNVINYQEGST